MLFSVCFQSTTAYAHNSTFTCNLTQMKIALASLSIQVKRHETRCRGEFYIQRSRAQCLRFLKEMTKSKNPKVISPHRG